MLDGDPDPVQCSERLFIKPSPYTGTSEKELKRVFEQRFLMSPACFEAILFKGLPERSEVIVTETFLKMKVACRSATGQKIMTDSRNFLESGEGLMAGSLRVKRSHQRYGLGAQYMSNLIALSDAAGFDRMYATPSAERGAHAWCGVFQPLISSAPMVKNFRENYMEPVTEKLERLSALADNVFVTDFYNRFKRADILDMRDMAELADCDVPVEEFLNVSQYEYGADPLSKAFRRSSSVCVDMQICYELAQGHDGHVHFGKFVTVGSSWFGGLEMEKTEDVDFATRRLMARVERGKARAKADGIHI